MPTLFARLALPVLLGALLAAPPLARAAEPTAAPATVATAAPSAAQALPSASVRVMNRDVVRFRASFLGHPPTVRAAAATERIEMILSAGGPGQVTLAPVEDGVLLQLDGKLAFVITPGDADPLLDQDRDAVAKAAAAALTQVAREHAEAEAQPNPRTVAFVVGVTTVWLLVLFALGSIRRAVQRWLSARAEARMETVRIGGERLLDRDSVRGAVRAALQTVFLGIVLLLSYEWLSTVLQAFPYTRPWGERLAAFLIAFGQHILIATAEAAPGLFVVVVILFIARGVAGVSGRFLERVQRGEIEVGWVGPETALPTRRLFTAVIWLFALAMAYPYLPGSGSQAFQGLSVLVGLMISLGGASTVGQAAAGLILMYGRAFRVGEYVRIGDQEGTVTDIGAFQTRLRTGMGVEVVLPNSAVVSEVVHNYSRVVKGQGFVVDAVVTIGYDAPWRQVHALLTKAARATPGVLAEPAPVVFQTALQDFYVEYRLVAQATADQPRPRAEVMSLLNANIQDAFNEAGVQIMSPHYFADPAEPKLVPKDRWEPK
jgi:small-conductance mechanosensitive channel